MWSLFFMRKNVFANCLYWRFTTSLLCSFRCSLHSVFPIHRLLSKISFDRKVVATKAVGHGPVKAKE